VGRSGDTDSLRRLGGDEQDNVQEEEEAGEKREEDCESESYEQEAARRDEMEEKDGEEQGQQEVQREVDFGRFDEEEFDEGMDYGEESAEELDGEKENSEVVKAEVENYTAKGVQDEVDSESAHQEEVEEAALDEEMDYDEKFAEGLVGEEENSEVAEVEVEEFTAEGMQDEVESESSDQEEVEEVYIEDDKSEGPANGGSYKKTGFFDQATIEGEKFDGGMDYDEEFAEEFKGEEENSEVAKAEVEELTAEGMQDKVESEIADQEHVEEVVIEDDESEGPANGGSYKDNGPDALPCPTHVHVLLGNVRFPVLRCRCRLLAGEAQVYNHLVTPVARQACTEPEDEELDEARRLLKALQICDDDPVLIIERFSHNTNIARHTHALTIRQCADAPREDPGFGFAVAVGAGPGRWGRG
jgi:hypothetical protein